MILLPAHPGDVRGRDALQNHDMSINTLQSLSNDLAGAVAAVAPSVVQVSGRRRPATGLVYSDGVIVTTRRAIGGEDGLQVRAGDQAPVEAELAGWDPASGLAIIKAAGVGAPPARVSETPARVGHLAIAVARSWSNAITATIGLVSVIGGPLPTGRRQSIPQVIRTSAPMHGGFAGGAFVDAAGALLGVTTAAEIRGLGVVIPAAIAWSTVASILQHGRVKRGYLGIGGQPVRMATAKAGPDQLASALLVVAVSPESPAAAAGLIVGDVIMAFDGQPVQSPDDLLDLLVADRVGRDVPLRVLRGGSPIEIKVKVAERTAS